MKAALFAAALAIMASCGTDTANAASERHDLMPRVIELTDAEMRARWCPADLPDHVECFTPGALYSQGVIYVPEGYQPFTVREVGLLLHEFVHHGQHMLGMIGRECMGAIERHAYGVQEEWLAQNGMKPEPGVDFPGPLYRMHIESCEGY